LIGITQPRRVAAVSLAKRVSDELQGKFGETVGYQIRYDSKFYSPEKTKIKFMTDGILLKELETDFMLKKYSVLIIDEAHERSLNSDILVSLLTRIAQARCDLAFKERKEGKQITFPLRLVIMSATLRVADFHENERLFPDHKSRPRVIKVEARQFPVAVHFSKVTKDDY
jgi:ATP-dependent RNA helicase DHX37/DHR1